MGRIVFVLMWLSLMSGPLWAFDFRLAWIPSGSYSYALVAQELGFWKESGLDVKIHRGFGSSKTASDIATGQFDVGEASFSVAVVATLRAKKNILVSLGTRSYRTSMGIVSKPGWVEKPKDLEGKTLAASPASGCLSLFPIFSKTAGFEADKVNWNLMAPSLSRSSFLNGKIDGLCTYFVSFAPALLERGQKFDFISYADEGLEMLEQVFIANPERLAEDGHLYRRFINGAFKGLSYSLTQPEKSVDIASMLLPMSKRETVKYGLAATGVFSTSPYAVKKGLGWTPPSLVNATVKLVEVHEGETIGVSVEKLYTNRFVGREKLTSSQWKRSRKWIENLTGGE